jgi:hypothetical protein
MWAVPFSRDCRNSLHHAACAIALLCSLCMTPCQANAEELVLHKFIAKEPTPRIEDLLYLAAGIELMRAGLSSTRTGGGEDYQLLTDYSTSGGNLSVSYVLVSPDAPGSALASAQVTLPLGQDLDEKIGSTIAGLLQQARIQAVPSEKAEIKGLLPEASAGEGGAGASPASPVSPVSPAAPAVPAVSSSPPFPEAAPAKAPPRMRTPEIMPVNAQLQKNGPGVRFVSSVSAAGVLFLGQMTQYFHYGVAGLADVGLAWPGESLTIGLGVEMSLIRALNDYQVVGGPLYFSMAGLKLQLGTGTRSSSRIDGEISGGAAFVTVAGGQQTLVQTAPYGSLGASAVFPLGGSLSLGGNVRFLTIFDNGLFVMGVVPSVTLRMGP